MKCSNIINRLLKKASSSSCRFKVAAIGIDKKGNIIDCTNNHHRFVRYGGGIHAEQKLIMRNPRSLATIVILRVGKNGDVLPIDPCPKCSRLANKRGIKIVSIRL